MKKGLIGLVAALCITGLAAGGYMIYLKKQEQQKYSEELQSAISKIEQIEVMEGENLPSNEEVLGNNEYINLDTVVADIQRVDVTTPGEYTMAYTFQDTQGTERTIDVPCLVKPELLNHVSGLEDIEIDYGEELPEIDCTYDEYISSVTRSEEVNSEEPGTYDVTYTILGVNGEMEEVEYVCVVNDTRPSPTPTPTPEPETETETETEAMTETEDDGTISLEEETEEAMGNVPETEKEVVKTGDANNMVSLIVLIILCAGILGYLAFARIKKKNK